MIVMPMIVLAEEHTFKYVFKHIMELVFQKVPLLKLPRMSCGCTASTVLKVGL